MVKRLYLPFRSIFVDEINEDLQLDDALDRYIDNSPDLHERRQELKDHALRLERKLELGQITAENGT